MKTKNQDDATNILGLPVKETEVIAAELNIPSRNSLEHSRKAIF